LIEHYPHIANNCQITALAPYVGAHFQPPVPIKYHLYSQGVVTHEWPEAAVGAAMILLAHCAFHVGQVRKIISQLEK